MGGRSGFVKGRWDRVGIKRRARSGGVRRLSGLVIGIALRSNRERGAVSLGVFLAPSSSKMMAFLSYCSARKSQSGDLVSTLGNSNSSITWGRETGTKKTKRDT